jgi:PAS domain S-box-containing protein
VAVDLPEADALLAAIVASSDDAIVGKSLDGTIRIWNAAAERLLGWTAAEAIGKSITLVIPPERLGEEASVIARIRANESIRHYETVRMRKDGGRIDVSLSISPVRDASGQVVMAAKIMRDITRERVEAAERERMLVNEQLARAEAESMQRLLEEQAVELEEQAAELEATIDELRLANDDLIEAERLSAERQALVRGFFGAPGLMMFVLELDHATRPTDYRIVLANGAASAWLGVEPETVVGRTGASLGMSPESGARLLAMYLDVWTSRRALTVEAPSAARPGNWVRMSVSPIGTEAHSLPRLAVIMVDASAEHAHEEQRRRLERLVENATDFIAVAREGLELEYVNPAGLSLVGASSFDAIRGRSALDLFELESRFRLENEILPSLRNIGRWSGESRLRQMDTGASIPIELTVFPVFDPDTGEPLAIAAVGRGIAERQRLQSELRQAQKMEAVGQLAGGVAHDFNNLLSIILSYSMMVAESLPSHDPVRADVEEIRLAGERAATLTRQLLAFSRQQVLQPQATNLNEVVAGIEKMLRRLIGEDIELIVDRANALGDAMVDPGQIEQVIMNLAVNARDAMPEGGKLTIETSNVEVDEIFARAREGIETGRYVLLAVSDTGEGMDAATQERMFEPFFTTKGVGKGTGLGLSTVFGILKQSGGTIRVYSEPGRGTSMKVYLPRIAGSQMATPSAPTAAQVMSGGNETILLVEDEQQVRLVASTILRRHGYHVLEAQSGGDALLICEQHAATIHLLLTDVVMQRMSGPMLAERLGRLRPDMKVLFMSGYTDRAVINHALLESNTSFIQKPFTPERLAQRVRDVLDARAKP